MGIQVSKLFRHEKYRKEEVLHGWGHSDSINSVQDVLNLPLVYL